MVDLNYGAIHQIILSQTMPINKKRIVCFSAHLIAEVVLLHSLDMRALCIIQYGVHTPKHAGISC